jgi:hypothetical protein
MSFAFETSEVHLIKIEVASELGYLIIEFQLGDNILCC